MYYHLIRNRGLDPDWNHWLCYNFNTSRDITSNLDHDSMTTEECSDIPFMSPGYLYKALLYEIFASSCFKNSN